MLNTIKKKSTTVKPKKTFSHYYLTVFSRHPSTKPLRRAILIKGKRVVYRHGSTSDSATPYEINSVSSVRTSADKLLMKQAFDKAGIHHASWMKLSDHGTKEFGEWLTKIGFPKKRIIIKHRFGSRGNGNYYITSKETLDSFVNSHKGGLSNYIVEEYMNYTVEYRLHVTERGHFYTCRKVLKNDTPKDKRFQRHDDNCSWLLETNPSFNKPKNWNDIVADCVKALKTMGGDVMAFDVKCTSKKNSKDGFVSWILLESCSAPAFGEKMMVAYKNELPLIVQHKYKL
jgi:hypothetical protein